MTQLNFTLEYRPFMCSSEFLPVLSGAIWTDQFSGFSLTYREAVYLQVFVFILLPKTKKSDFTNILLRICKYFLCISPVIYDSG